MLSSRERHFCFSSRRRHTRSTRDWSSDVCSSDLGVDQARVLLVAAAVESLLGYTFLTRMHERYLFLTLACLAPVVFARPLRLTYIALSGLFILNLWYPFAGYNTGQHVQAFRFEPWYDWIYGGFATDPWQKKALSLAVTAVALVAAWGFPRWLEQLEPGAPPAPRASSPGGFAAPLRLPRLATPADDAADSASSLSLTRRLPLVLVGLTVLFGF